MDPNELRQKILEIQRDTNLTDEEKAKKRQALMCAGFEKANPTQAKDVQDRKDQGKRGWIQERCENPPKNAIVDRNGKNADGKCKYFRGRHVGDS